MPRAGGEHPPRSNLKGENLMTKDPANFREYAGVVAAYSLVVGMMLIGPMDIVAKIYNGQPVSISEVWMSAMITMGGGATGFLFGKQSTGSSQPSLNIPVGD